MSSISDKPNEQTDVFGWSILNGFWNPTIILLVCFMLIVAGLTINYFRGFQGTMLLSLGQGQSEMNVDNKMTRGPSDHLDLDFMVRLDSLTIEQHSPDFEMLVWRQDTSNATPLTEGESSQPQRVARFAPEPMVIRKINGTDFRFRVREIYPDFSFSYSYPQNIDTIQPKAPGVMLELKTDDGEAVVTLRSDIPNRDKLADIVNLGAELEFYWDVSPDSITAIETHATRNTKIVFAGRDRIVYYLFNGNKESQPLDTTLFYEIPGKKGIGFRILHLFPDAAYLKAFPSTKSNEFLNPVAKVEIWRIGQGYQEAFLYPEMKGRKGGQFQVPGTPYSLAMSISQQHELQYCQCTITVLDAANDIVRTQDLSDGKTMMYRACHSCLWKSGYRLSLAGYDPQNPDRITLFLSHRPGNMLFFTGSLLIVIAMAIMFLRKNPAKSAGIRDGHVE